MPFDLSLDEAEAAFLQDVISGAEAESATSVTADGLTDENRTPTRTSGPLLDSTLARGPLILHAASSQLPVRTASFGRPPLPRNTALTPVSCGGEAPGRLPRPLLRQDLAPPLPPGPQHVPSQVEQATFVPSLKEGLGPRRASAKRTSAWRSSGSGDDGYTGASQPAHDRDGNVMIAAHFARPASNSTINNSHSCTTAISNVPACSSKSLTSGCSDAGSNSSSGSGGSGSGAAPDPRRGSVRSASATSGRRSPPADPSEGDVPGESRLSPACGLPRASAPTRQAKGLLHRIRTLEAQLQQLLQAEAETGASLPIGSAHMPGSQFAPAAPPPALQPGGLAGRDDPACSAPASHQQARSSSQSGHGHQARHQPLVYLVAEQLCRDYNSSGVALMEAGLDQAAREQLEKALLLAEHGGPLEGRPEMQREMQVVAHNNLACYHRKMREITTALEHLLLVARLETAAAAAVTTNALEHPASPSYMDGASRGRAASSGAERRGPGDEAPSGSCPVGPTAATLLNLAACCSSLGQHPQALEFAARAVPAAANELQVSVPVLEAALTQGLPQAQMWDVLPQLRRAAPGTTTQLAMAYYNRAVEQEHLHLWQPALESYRLAVDVAGRFVGRAADLTLTMQQSMEAFKVRLRRLERQGKVRPRATSACTGSSRAAAAAAVSTCAALAATSSPAPAPHSSRSSAMASRHLQPRPQLRSLRCASLISPSYAHHVAVAVPPPRRRSPPTSLPTLSRTSPTAPPAVRAAAQFSVSAGGAAPAPSGAGRDANRASTSVPPTYGGVAVAQPLPSGVKVVPHQLDLPAQLRATERSAATLPAPDPSMGLLRQRNWGPAACSPAASAAARSVVAELSLPETHGGSAELMCCPKEDPAATVPYATDTGWQWTGGQGGVRAQGLPREASELGGGAISDLACAAAAAAAAAAELALVCGGDAGEEEPSARATEQLVAEPSGGSASVSASDGGTGAKGASCRVAGVPLEEVSAGLVVWGTEGVSTGTAGSHRMAPVSNSFGGAGHNMLAPKRDGVAV